MQGISLHQQDSKKKKKKKAVTGETAEPWSLDVYA